MLKQLIALAICCFLPQLIAVSAADPAGNETFQVTVTVAGPGRVQSSPPGIDCGPSVGDCSAKFSPQAAITLTPSTEGQAEFQGWSSATGDAAQCPGTDGPCSFVITQDTAVAAAFVPKPTTALRLGEPRTSRAAPDL